MPVIRKLLPRRDWMLAMLITSSCFTRTARPFASFLPLSLYSTNRVAIGLPMLSLVKLDMMLPPALSSEMLTCGWLYSSWLEVESGGVSKGHALEAVAKKLGYSLKDCIAFGDGMNDA
eukprot:97809_1